MYTTLHHCDSIRLLQLVKRDVSEPQLRGRLITTRLCEQPTYTALSYVWGSQLGQRVIALQDQNVSIGRNLFDCLKELSSRGSAFTIWADQVCINQNDEEEKEKQVRLMGSIYSSAKLVIGWIGQSTPERILALKAFQAMGLSFIDQKGTRRFRLAMRNLLNTGHLTSLRDLGHPDSAIWRAVISFVELTWFQRLWIVQEVCLAQDLELRCGKERIAASIFFEGVEALCSTATNPPDPQLLEPYRCVLRLGKIRKRLLSGNFQSYPRLAHLLSEWQCGKDEDRLNALYGISFKDDPHPWFEPCYSLSPPRLFQDFARRHIQSTQSLEILHFAGCGDGDLFQLAADGTMHYLQLNPPAQDVPSWVPDWRIRTRPLVLAPPAETSRIACFCTTITKPEYTMDSAAHVLTVRALQVDEILACGIPNCDVLQALGLGINDLFRNWFGVCQKYVTTSEKRAMFGRTLLMNGDVRAIERVQIEISPDTIAEYFDEWAERNLEEPTHSQEDLSPVNDRLDKATHYAYLAEEICRNRSFFVTKRGFIGLGSLTVAPTTSVVLIHGLKTPFLVQRGADKDIFRGECYIHGMMEQRQDLSDDDIYLSLA